MSTAVSERSVMWGTGFKASLGNLKAIKMSETDRKLEGAR